MANLNKKLVDVLFHREAVLIGTQDAVPTSRVAALFGEGAVKHARGLCTRQYSDGYSSYGVGDYDLEYLTYRGFQAAASFYNVQQFREDAGE